MLLFALLAACTDPPKPGDPAEPGAGDDTADTDTADPCGTWYTDADADGYGDPATDVVTCAPDADAVSEGGDCDDRTPAVHPAADEVCDGLDNDCDEMVDDVDNDVDANTLIRYALDVDGDGYTGTTSTVWTCTQPAGSTEMELANDCDDDDPAVNPAAEEICANGVDDDCDGTGNECGFSDGMTSRDADVTYEGTDSYGEAGYALAIGDLDGDGDADLVVGTPNATGTVGNPGRAEVYTTNALGTVTEASAWGSIEPGVTALFHESGFGRALAFAGDPDGDGKDDLVVGGPVYADNTGLVAFYRGSATLPTTSAWSATGVSESERSDQCGADVAGGMDVDGDGAADFVYGCLGEGEMGAVHIVGTGATYTITSASAVLGQTVSLLDYDGDGVGDVVTGSADENRVFLFVGGAAIGDADDLVDAEWFFGSPDFGTYLEGVGDLNGDGYDDFVAAGMRDTWLCTGAASGTGYDHELGRPMTAAASGDFDGDGALDLALGDGGSDTTLVAWGPVGGVPSSWTSITSVGEGFGAALAAGDLDDDGVDDLAVGAPGRNGDVGGVHVFLGQGL